MRCRSGARVKSGLVDVDADVDLQDQHETPTFQPASPHRSVNNWRLNKNVDPSEGLD